MPNRVIREAILESDKVNKLTWAGEVFYRRLMSVVDDFGRGDGRTAILRTKLYPLRIEKVSESDIVKWISECEEAGLVRQYQVDGKEYLVILNFGQSVRIKKAKFPPPPCVCKHLNSSAFTCEQMCARNETETETETETTSHTHVPREPLDVYESGQQMFEEVRDDELFLEHLLRIVHAAGFISCQRILLLKSIRFFITREAAKPDFKEKPRSEHKKYLVNWITTKATTLNQYAGT